MKKSIILLGLSLITIASCKLKKPDSSQPNWGETSAKTPKGGEKNEDGIATQPIYNASETRHNDLIHTLLRVRFNWETQQLFGEAELTLRPYFHETNTVILDAKAMKINKVMLLSGEKKGELLNYKYDGAFLKITLPQYYKRTSEYKILIDYTANPEEVEQEGSAAIMEAKGLYFINHDGSNPKKHMEIWTQGETEASSVWFPTIDSPNEKTTQEMYITVDNKYTTLSNGLLEASEKNANGTRTDYWNMDQPHSPYLFMMAVGEFAIVKDEWTKKDGSKMEVNYYVEKEYEEHAKAIFGKTPAMLDFFSERLGVEYPWAKYSQIVVRDYVSGAMENTTATIHGDFLYQTTRELLDDDNESIIAHELFHHWFGDLVTCESWSNLPLNESFANYSQYLWDEHAYGRMEADEHAYSEMDGYFLSAESGGHVDMIRYDYASKEDMFDGHSYNKGGRILHMLRTHLGDEAFFEALKNYLNDNKFQATEIHELRMQFEKVSGQDLNWFFNQWFLSSGHPIVKITQKYDASNQQLNVTISQNQDTKKWPLFQLPIEIDIYKNGLVRKEKVWITDASQTFTFDKIAIAPDLVNVDATKTTLWKKEDQKPTSQWIYQLNNAPLWLDKKEAFDKLKSSNDADAIYAIVKALDHEKYNIRLLAIHRLSKAAIKQAETVNLKLIDLAQNDKNSTARSESLYALTEYFSNNATTDKALELGLKDSSYLVLSTALQGLGDTRGPEGLILAKQYQDEPNSKVNLAVASVYAKNGGPAEWTFFEDNVTELNGNNKIYFLQHLYSYSINQPDEAAIKAMPVLINEIEADNIWYSRLVSYRLLFGLKSHYTKRINEIDTKLQSLTKEGAGVEQKLVLEKEKNFCKAKEQEILAKYNVLKEKETDPQVLGRL
jgi:aminopeptidase N